MGEEDITKTGPVGLEGLKGINYTEGKVYDIQPLPTENDLWLNTLMSLDSSVSFDTGQNLGESRWDKGIYSSYDIENIEDIRAKNQTTAAKWANSGVKMLGTFGTTFIDGTLGTLVGLGTGIYNLFDDDENTGFISGMWNNSVTQVTQQISNSLEENFQNYRTNWEKNAAWYERLGTANFWSEGVLKNMGFMMGTAASMVAWGGVGNILGVTKTLSNLGKVGKLAGWTGRTMLSASGESAVEAKNSMQASLKSINFGAIDLYDAKFKQVENEYKQLDIWKEEELKNLYSTEENPNALSFNEALIESEYKRRKGEIDFRKFQLNNSELAFEKEKQKALIEASNKIYLANLVFLSITNNINMGSLVRGGYNNSSDLLKHITRQVNGEVVTNPLDFAKGVMKGTASYASEAIDNVTGKTIGRGLLNMAAEGFQEGGQKVSSTSNEMQLQAKLNKFINSQVYEDFDGNVTPLFTRTLNPTVSEELVDYYKALNETFKQEFGTLSSPGWEEVFIGAISSGIGTPTINRTTSIENGRIKKGPYKLSWTGNAFWEAHQDIVGDKPVLDEYVNALNEHIKNPEMQTKIKTAITSASINDDQNKALLDGDIFQYKNSELAQIVNSAIFFKNAGLMDDYMALYDNYAEGLTEEDLKELYALTYSPVTGDSPLTEQQKDDIKNNIREKAKSTKHKIEQVIDRFSWNSEHYGNKFSDNYRDKALSELTYIDALSWDIARRIDEMQSEANNLENDYSEGAVQRKGIIKKEIEQLIKSKNALDKKYREYTKYPEKLEKQIQYWQDEYDKYQIGKDATATLERYKQATTIKDIWDIYRHTNEENRDKVFNTAISQASPEVASLMAQFKNFSSDIEALENIIEEENKNLPEEFKNNIINYEKRWIRSIAEEIINDNTPILTRQNLQDKIQQSIDDLNSRISSIYNLDEDGYYHVPESRTDEYYFLIQQRTTFEDYLQKLINLDKTRSAGENTIEDTIEDEKTEEEETGFEENVESEPTQLDTEIKEDNNIISTNVNGIEIRHIENADSYSQDSNEVLKVKNALSAYSTTEELDFLKTIIKGIKKGVVLPTKIVSTLSSIIEDRWGELKEWYETEYSSTNNTISEPVITQNVQPTTQEKPTDEEEKTKSKGSFKGHVFEKFRFSELATNKRLVLNPGAKEVNGRYKIQKFIDNYLHKVPKGTKIRYIYNEDFPNIILLGINTEDISNILDRNNMSVVTTSKKSSNKTEEYVIIGTLGYELGDSEMATQWSIIKNKLLQERKESITESAIHFVSSFYNEVKDISGGQLVTRLVEQLEEKHSYLEDLLNRDYSNPQGLTINDIKFAVVEGTEDNPKYVYLRVNSNDILYETKGRPGQVIMYIPDAKGAYVPTIIDPIFWKDLKRAHNWSGYLRDTITNLYNTINSGNKEAAKKAIAELRDILIFGEGNNIFYNEDSNTLKYQVNGQETFTIDTKDSNSLYSVLNILNPRINIATSVLRSNPGIYSDVITTNLAILGAVGAQFYLHPVDNEGNMVKTQPVQTTPKPNIQRNSLSILYYNDSQYKTDGTNVYDYKGNAILDSKLEQELLTILGIQNDKYPKVIVNSTTYYETPTGIYMHKQQGYRKLTDQEASKYREKKNKQKVKEEIPQAAIEATSTNMTETASSTIVLNETEVDLYGFFRKDLEEKTRTWDSVLKESTIRKVDGIDYVRGNFWLNAKVGLQLAITAGILPNTYSEYLEDITLNNYNKITGELKALGIISVADIVSYIDKHTKTKEEGKSNTSVVNSSTNTKENYNGEDATQLKSQKDLENTQKSIIFAAMRNRDSRNRILDAIKSKGYTMELKTPADVENALKSLNIAIDNIENIDTLIDIINNCR